MKIKSYFRETNRLYFQEEIKGKHPISETDALLFSIILELIKFYPICGGLRHILEQYKIKNDAEVIDNLLELYDFESKNGNSEITNELGDVDSSEEGFVFFTEIKGNFYYSSKIASVEKVEHWSEQQECTIYSILINRTESANVYYGNTRIDFLTKHKRDSVINDIKSNMIKHIGAKFI